MATNNRMAMIRCPKNSRAPSRASRSPRSQYRENSVPAMRIIQSAFGLPVKWNGDCIDGYLDFLRYAPTFFPFFVVYLETGFTFFSFFVALPKRAPIARGISGSGIVGASVEAQQTLCRITPC
jgi:hypothetical protein